VFVAVLIGGSVGALVRSGIHVTLFDGSSAALLVVNFLGSFALGVVAVRLIKAPTLHTGLGVGFCGALTSMSTFAVDVASRLHGGQVGTAAVLTVATVMFTLIGAAAGMRLGDPS